MKRNPSRSGARSLADELAELRGLNATALRQRWRVLYRTEAPGPILGGLHHRYIRVWVLEGSRPDYPNQAYLR